MQPTDTTQACSAAGDVHTGNVEPLLNEILHALQHWLDTGEETVIDLRSIPLGPGEEDRIVEALGQGEVQARLSALGPSEIYETAFPGVWLVVHYNRDDEVMGKFIEVRDIPRLLKAQEEDVRAGLERLKARFGR